jgi:hypothetical protein
VHDLRDERVLITKAALFVVAGALAGLILLSRTAEWTSLLLLVTCIWSFARAYYFAFYVIEHYVDRSHRFSGIASAVRFLWSTRGERRGLSNETDAVP